jgi:ubiquinone/menaquinone biosynthesis C-methylase UbiE
MLFPLTHRQRQPEWMDAPDADPAELARSLIFIQRINRFLGYTQHTINHLARFSRRWKKQEPIRMIDFATGSADVPRAILRWADHHGLNIHITALDLHPATVEIARKSNNDPRLQIICASAMAAPFESASFDYALNSMFLHHLSEEEAVSVLIEMARVAGRGIIVSDLLRHRRALAWITLFTLFSNPMVKHDARVSVQQAFRKEEVLALRDRAGLAFAQYHRHSGHRFVLAGER